MPNTPVSVNRGVSAIVADEYARETQIELVKELFAPLGEVVLLDKESEIDVVTAISGSGPAYVFNFIENCFILSRCFFNFASNSIINMF